VRPPVVRVALAHGFSKSGRAAARGPRRQALFDKVSRRQPRNRRGAHVVAEPDLGKRFLARRAGDVFRPEGSSDRRFITVSVDAVGIRHMIICTAVLGRGDLRFTAAGGSGSGLG
jgi:hypothetical protein